MASMASLPQYLIVNAGYNRYVLFEPSFEENHVRMTPVKNPRNRIDTYMNGAGGMLERREYVHVRKTSEGDMLYTTVMEKLDMYVNTDAFGKIYRYIVEKPNVTLPIEYYNVYKGKDLTSEWHVIITYEPPKAPTVVPKVVAVPKYVLKGFVDSLIVSKESCPVTMDELKAGDISLTKCFHAFSRGSIEHIMKTTKRCPTCRTELDDIELF